MHYTKYYQHRMFSVNLVPLEYQSNTVHSEQPKLNTYEGEQAQQSFGSADANTGSINDTQQNKSSTVNQEPLNMDMSGSDDTVPVDETNAGKAEKLIRA